MHANRLIVLPSSINNVRLILFPNKGQTCVVLSRLPFYRIAQGKIVHCCYR
uniref:Uncharacterized protein n=1 Tax=Anguilla anguilla TaxID=7936 RepID=A0A0E9UW55_ANGAN